MTETKTEADMADREALARIEERVATLTKAVDELRAEATELKSLVNRGRGAFWAVCAVGAAITWIIATSKGWIGSK